MREHLTFMELPDDYLRRCPQHVIHDLLEGDRPTLLVITWDELEGFAPEDPGYGYQQFSVRPYRVTDRCDGSRDPNALWVLRQFLSHAGLDWMAVHQQSYPEEQVQEPELWEDPQWAAKEIEMPPLDEKHFLLLLESLDDMNHHTLVATLRDLLEKGQILFVPQGASHAS